MLVYKTTKKYFFYSFELMCTSTTDEFTLGLPHPLSLDKHIQHNAVNVMLSIFFMDAKRNNIHNDEKKKKGTVSMCGESQKKLACIFIGIVLFFSMQCNIIHCHYSIMGAVDTDVVSSCCFGFCFCFFFGGGCASEPVSALI